MFSEEIQRVYEEIRNDILNEAYEPGQALPEIPLAQKYGVKRTRIRQIFQKLEQDTLIEIVRARGAFVKSISLIEFQEIFEIREALEGMAARLAARKRRDKDIEEIIKDFDILKNAREDDHLGKKVEIGGKLHEFILQSAGNKRFISILEPLQLQVRRIWNRGIILSPERINRAFNEHIEILTFLQTKDESMSEQKMRAHISNAFKDYIRVLFLNE